MYVGGLIGCNGAYGRVIGCHSGVNVTGRGSVGGLVGYHAGNIISNCYATGNVTNLKRDQSYQYPNQAWELGGLVGRVGQDAAIINCAAHGAVTTGAGSWSAGGLVGYDAGGLLFNCYATGDVTVTDTVDGVGGLVGESAVNTTVATCYSAGRLRWGTNVKGLGGLIGWTDTPSVRSCYCLAEEDGGGPDNDAGVPLRLSDLENRDRFVGWDFGTSDVDGLLHPWVMSLHRKPELNVLREATVSPLAGHGTPSEPYRIRSGGDLTWVALHPQAVYRLEADLDLGYRTWTQAAVPCLAGVFDGKGRTVRNIDITGHGCLGFFSFVGRRAVVTHLNLANGDINPDGPGSRVGMLAGINAGTIVACAVSDSRIRGTHDSHVLGGLVGKNVAGAICSCAADTMVGGRECSYLGGLVGWHGRGAIRNCFTQGRVISGAPSQYVGGLAGVCGDGMMSCLSVATVSNDSTVSYHGGLAGAAYAVSHSYYLSSQDGGGPNRGPGSPLTYEQMRKPESFVGWDFTGSAADGTVNAWTMSGAEPYPSLSAFGAYEPPALPGSGSEADPYLIGSAEELGAIYYRPDKHYCLVSDIDCSGIHWTGSIIPYFTGHLAGRGFSLSNIRMTAERMLGFFGVIAAQGGASGLVLDRVDITLGERWCFCIGSLAGRSEGMVQDCHVLNAGAIQNDSTSLYIGGLVGENSDVVRCSSSCLPIQLAYEAHVVGGLVGANLGGGIISECCANSRIICGDYSDEIAGLVGWHDGSLIVNCYASGSIVAGRESEFLGGLVGTNGSNRIMTCYASGSMTVEGDGEMGGVVGCNLSWNDRYVENSYSLAPGDGGGPDNGLGSPLTHAEMCQPENFIGWDFADETVNGTRDVWTICEGRDYPRLSWEQVGCSE